MPEIRRIRQAEIAAVLPDLERLFGQLSKNHVPFTIDQLEVSLSYPSVIVLGAFDDGNLVGVGTLVLAPLLNKITSFIEDVVVDEAYRGQGLGKKITQELIKFAQSSEAVSVNLMSEPKRIAANLLYQSLGFELRTTNVYRLNI